MNPDRSSSLLDEIDATGLLAARPVRDPDWRVEAEALSRLAEVFATAPERLAQALAEAALAMTGAAASGISLDEVGSSPPVFRWVATAGTYAGYRNGTMPRDFSPCGEVLRRNRPVLMREMHRLYAYVSELHAPPHEVLLVPFLHAGQPVGTVWVVSHDDQRPFDREDLRIVQTLTRFAGAAVGSAGLVSRLTDANTRQSRELADRGRRIDQLTAWFDLGPGFAAYADGSEHEFVFANQPFRSLMAVDDVIGRRAAAFDIVLDGQPWTAMLDGVRDTGRPLVAKGLALAGSFGSRGAERPTHLDLVIRPDIDPDGLVIGVFVHASDCSERVRALEGLRALDARKDRFLVVLAHEMRTPLSAIALGAQVLKLKGDDAIRRMSAIGAIERQTDQLTALVKDMTDVVAIRSGKLTLNKTVITVREIVAKAVESCDAQLQDRQQTLHLHLPDQPLRLEGDGTRLTQVVANLIGNASKYTPRQGSIDVRVVRRENVVELSIVDSGIGIAPAELPRVFDMYMQVPMPDRPVDSGLGIGLALVRQFVEMHGGSVAAASDGLGKGSTFCVTLPLLAP